MEDLHELLALLAESEEERHKAEEEIKVLEYMVQELRAEKARYVGERDEAKRIRRMRNAGFYADGTRMGRAV